MFKPKEGERYWYMEGSVWGGLVVWDLICNVQHIYKKVCRTKREAQQALKKINKILGR